MNELKSNFKALIDNELEHEKLYSDLLDDLEIFKIRFREELSTFSVDLSDYDLKIYYEDRMIYTGLYHKDFKYFTGRKMKTADGSLVFNILIPDLCYDIDFDIIQNVIFNILDVKVI